MTFLSAIGVTKEHWEFQDPEEADFDRIIPKGIKGLWSNCKLVHFSVGERAEKELLYIVVSGEGTFNLYIGDVVFPEKVRQGDVLRIPPKMIHNFGQRSSGFGLFSATRQS